MQTCAGLSSHFPLILYIAEFCDGCAEFKLEGTISVFTSDGSEPESLVGRSKFYEARSINWVRILRAAAGFTRCSGAGAAAARFAADWHVSRADRHHGGGNAE